MPGPLVPVHLCGSVPLADATAVFTQAAHRLGVAVGRIPDGETGVRDNWVVWQLPMLQAHPDLETVPPPSPEYGPSMRVQAKPGIDPASVRFESLGYADAARASWQIFSELQDGGVIAPEVRFQVSLPTPIAVVAAFVGAHQAELEVAYEDAILRELAEIVAAVPADRLAVQWDTAVEFAVFEGVFPSWFGADYDDQRAEVARRLVRLGNAVPAGVQLGYHLCYGDFGHEHFVEPADTSKLADIANDLGAGLDRDLNWVHLPVPRGRDDAAYFEPLSALALRPETTVYLGLVHATDGQPGAERRIAAARAAISEFGIATECGMGRRPAEQIPGLLDLHAQLAAEL
ncbi:hypothetical protein MU582_04160 [Nocardioidaceae bacterium SCSIO 66511]|nr:hypothetical protein MU582_04160 [Nocardioidaceae bacterium SCSIO 66511]